MLGYTSTSLDFEIAKRFALQDLPSDKVPVIFTINFESKQGLFAMSEGYSAFNEQEVLIQDGLEYLVTSNHFQTFDDKQICCIEF